MLDKLLDESSELSAEVKASIVEAFDAAVQAKIDEAFEAKVSEKTLELVESKEAEYHKYLEEVEAAHAIEAKEFKDSIVESLDAYLEQYVSEMINKNIDEMQSDIDAAKSVAIVEAFEKLGMNVVISEKTSESALEEAKKELSAEIESLKEKANEVINENIELKASIVDMKKAQIVKESSEGLTELQKEKIEKLVEAFADDKDIESFIKKVAIVVESIKSSDVDVKKEEINENSGKDVKFKPKFL